MIEHDELVPVLEYLQGSAAAFSESHMAATAAALSFSV
jgi:hypothetical protein